MYAVNMNFSGILEWFQDSEYQNLMMFLHGFNLGDSNLEEHIIRNQEVINRITGNHTAYLCMDSTLSETDGPVPVNVRSISLNQIRCGCSVVDEIIEYYNIARINLPALIVMTKKHGYRLYPFKTVDQFNRLLDPISIVTSYRMDVSKIEGEIQTLERLDSTIEETARSIMRYSNEIANSRKIIDIIDNSDIVERIDYGYRVILCNLKQKGEKQKTINNIFLLTQQKDSKEIVERLVEIGLSEELVPTAEAFFDDLKQLNLDGRFQTQNGKINKQIKIYRKGLESLVIRKEEFIERKQSLLCEYQKQKESAPAEIERLTQIKNDLLSQYAQRLREATMMEAPISILTEYYINSSCILTLLDHAYDREQRINLILESLQRLLDERQFDTFISCKSQDYMAAGVLYDLLEEIGRKPFLADVSLREIGTDDFGVLIRTVISHCKYMTVYASDTKHMTTSYVFKEWNQFLNLLSQGGINGKIFSIVPRGTVFSDLPDGLSDKEFFFIDDYKQYVSDYLGK